MTNDLDSVDLEVFRTRMEAIAEEMGAVLIQGAFSPNITERRDCSTAIFDPARRLVAQAEHIPVHLGAMPAAVEAVQDCDPDPGDVFLCNDPFQGGTHLPDLTLVSPIHHDGTHLGYAASRAHHADVGGMTPGSMPADSRDLHQEGIRIPPVRLVRDGTVVSDVESLFLANVRQPRERRADLRAQLGAHRRAESRLGDHFEAAGERLFAGYDALIEYSRRRVEAELADIPDGTYRARDALEGDGVTEREIPVAVSVTVDGPSVTVDFAGTADQVTGNVNAPLAVARSAVYYVIRCITDPDIPPNHGCYESVTVAAPEGSLLNPDPPAAVVGGNVETSQRVTDVVFAALAEAAPERIPAQGQGTMNNLVLGAESFSYYETIGGGMGASAAGAGCSGVQVGMTNTQNTPVEALELAYPLTVERYELRTGSGGGGRHAGGDGLVRAITVLEDATLSLLTERRRRAPRGLNGGEDGRTGRNLLDGTELPAKVTRPVDAGATVRVETPGGGGYGSPDSE